jgi:hypothetical protein
MEMMRSLRRVVRFARAARRGDLLTLALDVLDALPSATDNASAPGWIYAAVSRSSPHVVKVGFSNAPDRRMREIRGAGDAYEWRTVRRVAVQDMRAAEQRVHHALRDYRCGDRYPVSGQLPETFTPEDAVLAVFDDVFGKGAA